MQPSCTAPATATILGGAGEVASEYFFEMPIFAI